MKESNTDSNYGSLADKAVLAHMYEQDFDGLINTSDLL